MTTDPKILLCWAGRPGYIPPPQLGINQVTLYSHHDRLHPGTINPTRKLADRQDYDLQHVTQQIDDPASFDLVCISSGANTNNQPQNLDAFRCPKVLLVGDTHHICANPVRFVMDYLERERYDMVISMHNRDHMKWLRQVGDIRPGWFPGLTAEDIPHPFQHTRQQHVGFVGSWRRSHPRRKSFLTRLQRDGIPLDHRKLSRRDSAGHYARSLIAFNCSLNGDLNMRVHEILSAGGFLLSDKLAPAAGLDQMLEDGVDYVSYENYTDCRDKVRHFFEQPDLAVEIAANGLRKYQAKLNPEYLRQRFIAWALEGRHQEDDYQERVEPITEVAMAVRLSAYELAQRSQLRQEGTPVLLAGPKAILAGADLDGLVRVRPRVLVTGTVNQAVRWPQITAAQAAGQRWSMVMVDREHTHVLTGLTMDPQTVFVL